MTPPTDPTPFTYWTLTLTGFSCREPSFNYRTREEAVAHAKDQLPHRARETWSDGKHFRPVEGGEVTWREDKIRTWCGEEEGFQLTMVYPREVQTVTEEKRTESIVGPDGETYSRVVTDRHVSEWESTTPGEVSFPITKHVIRFGVSDAD